MRSTLVIVALMLALAYTSIRLAQARIFGSVEPCFCDACVARNYPADKDGIEYGTETEGK